MNPISSINAPVASPPVAPLMPGGNVRGSNLPGAEFKDLLLEGLDQVNKVQNDADQAVQSMFTGGDADPAEVLTAVQKADMAFRLMMQIRNKLVDAYQEIQNIRI